MFSPQAAAVAGLLTAAIVVGCASWDIHDDAPILFSQSGQVAVQVCRMVPRTVTVQVPAPAPCAPPAPAHGDCH